ncbi:hypothetical protein GCM10009715_28140 [Paeniglutamicibacter psychrophenolicus]
MARDRENQVTIQGCPWSTAVSTMDMDAASSPMMASEEMTTNAMSGMADVRRGEDMLFMQVAVLSPVGWESGDPRTSSAKSPV